MSNHSQAKSYQQGAALLVFIAALVMTLAWLSYGLLGDLGQKLKRQQAQDVGMVLAEVKENLLVFAESIPELYAGTSSEKSPGFLLCPDMRSLSDPDSGTSSGSCAWGTSNAIGRLPASKAGSVSEYFYFWSGEKNAGLSLWYSIADEYRYGATGYGSIYGNTINPVYGGLSPFNSSMMLDGNAVAAVVIAAGDPLASQLGRNHEQPASNQWPQFLESPSGGATGASFLSRPAVATIPFNDRVVGVSQAEFNDRMKRKVCSLARSSNWCSVTEFSALPATHWFKRFEWADSNGNGSGASRICSINSGNVAGMNIQECP
ncbi:MAG: hypothetical protein B7Y68_03305 [Thiotrichales bacterium 35-46-9]|nr:MAG: hypothetical protein B7Y68_03305 [Thiotrichales bacterium 35-46-9]